MSLIMYQASCNNQVIMTSTSSIALYISANHSPLLDSTHSVYKHAHIVIHEISWNIDHRINDKFKHICSVIVIHKA